MIDTIELQSHGRYDLGIRGFAMVTATTRGIDHIGITVPDINEATHFLVNAIGAIVLYDVLEKGEEPRKGSDAERRLGLVSGAQVVAIRYLRLPDGPGIELFEVRADQQRSAANPNDFGLQHLALYVDDMNACLSRFEEAGGAVLAPPHPLPTLESGEGNVFCYARTPWGSIIEFISYPSQQPYTDNSKLRRWVPTN